MAILGPNTVASGCIRVWPILVDVCQLAQSAQLADSPAMKHVPKSGLPQKPCVHCGRPMAWRKAWAKNWEEVKYCSDRCASEAKRLRFSQKSGRPQP